MASSLSRREVLAAGAATVASAAVVRADAPTKPAEFGFCLNTSTVRDNGKSRPITELIDIASKAGYSAIEPWVSELEAFVKAGNPAKDLGKRFADAGLKLPDAIGFAEWIVDDETRRKKGLEQAKRDMDLVAQVGGVRIAAPPVGATGGSKRDDPNQSKPVTDLLAAAERFGALLELGQSMGVTPIVEVWGFSKSLSRLGETLMVAAECGKAGGCVLPDVYHLYKGGSDFAGLHLVGAAGIGIFHVNDYPKIERGTITDADRVFPGDGVAPLKDVFRTLREIGYRGYLSLELFNREYWKRDPHEVAKEGLQKMKKAAG